MVNGASSSVGRLSRRPTIVRSAASDPTRYGRRLDTSTAARLCQARCRETVPAAAVRGSESAIAAYMPVTASSAVIMRSWLIGLAASPPGGSVVAVWAPEMEAALLRATQCAVGGIHPARAARTCRSRSSNGPIAQASWPLSEIPG